MRIFDQPIGRMYLWTIALLGMLAVTSSYALRVFPAALVVAVAFAGMLEIIVREYHLKQRFKVPFSGLITGLIIGSVAPINAPIPLVCIAVTIAILSKFFVKFKGSNIFNPASLGLIVALAVFGLGDEWWAASSYNLYGLAVTLTPVLIILAYEARRVTTAVSFVIANLVLTVAAGGAGAASGGSLIALLFGVNYYFAFVMVVEPKTSPHGKYAQAGYGAAIACVYFLLAHLRAPYPVLVALLAGNIAYLLYRRYMR